MTTVMSGIVVTGVAEVAGIRAAPKSQALRSSQTTRTTDSTGGIRGQVVDARSGRPLAGVTVTPLAWAPLTVPVEPVVGGVVTSRQSTVTDADGRFTLRGLSAGVYRVYAGAAAYLTAPFKRAEDGPPSAPIRVVEGEITSDVDFALVRTSAISGRIFGNGREGLAGARVELLREVYQPGALGPPVAAFTQTDERGDFRFADVPPGQYYVRAISSAIPLRLPGTGERARYSLTYFPNAPDLRDGQRVFVSPGQDVGGITFALEAAAPVTVRGRLVGADISAERARVILTALLGTELTSSTGAIDSEGNFEIGDVLPGSYLLRVSTPASIPGSGRLSLLTRTVQVFAGMDELMLVAEHPGQFSGTVFSDNREPLPFDVTNVRVAIPAALSEGGFGRVVVGADGAFEFDAVPGTSSLTVFGPDGWAVGRILVDGTELTGNTLDISSGGRQRLDIVLTNHLGSVAGRVTMADGDSVPDALVVLFPTRRDQWGTSRLTHTTFTDLDGTYSFDGVVPGEYQAIAVGTLPGGAWIDASVLDQLWARSTSVQVFGDETRAVSLSLVPGPDFGR